MALVYADEIRREVAALERRIKALGLQEHRCRKESLRIKQLGEKRAFGASSQQQATSMLQAIERTVPLIAEANRIAAEIEVQLRLKRDLQVRLRSAPERPRTRSHVASIAASGSKEFNAAIKRGSSVAVAWMDALVACLETARTRFGLNAVPEDAKATMRGRALKRHPTLKVEIRKLK
jgi:hypothetical protein